MFINSSIALENYLFKIKKFWPKFGLCEIDYIDIIMQTNRNEKKQI